ncbi:MAG: DUF4058 family protein [Pirellulaceae bacterium]
MAGPFPGMDPWLEDPALWPGVHQRFITYIADTLQPLLGRRYVAAVEERVYVASSGRTIVPDVSVRSSPRPSPRPPATAVVEADVATIVEFQTDDEVTEGYIQIIDLNTNEEVVTVIEVLSPTNKESGEGRYEYLAKQREVLESQANLVEIDCLRMAPCVVSVPQGDVLGAGRFDYLTAVSRAIERKKRSYFYARTLRQRLPRVAIPLRATDQDVTLDLQDVIDRIYAAGMYADRLYYDRPCQPPLRPEDEVWTRERIRQWRQANPE